MKAKLITLISPYGFDDLGLRSIHAFLKSKKFNVKFIFFKDWLHYYSFGQLITKIIMPTENEFRQLINLVRGSDLVGISVVSTLYPIVKEITERLHKELGVKVIWGGSHAIVKPEECIKTADYVCTGEGEYVMWKLASGMPLKKIENLWYKKNGKIFRNKRGKLVDIEELPNLDYSDEEKYVIDESGKKGIGQERMDYIKKHEYYLDEKGVGQYDPMNINPYITYMTSRGCPYSCYFCSNNIFRKLYKGCGPFLRRKSVKKVINELKDIIKYRKRIDAIIFIDDLFLFDKAWLKRFCEIYKKEIGIPFIIEAHPNAIDEELISMLSDAGLRGASVGIQHCKEIREKLFNRFTPDEKIIKANNILHKYNITPKYDFIVDIPGETEKDKNELLKLVSSLKRPFELNLFSIIHFPETNLTKIFLKKNLIRKRDIEGNATTGINFPCDLKIKERRQPYKVLILLYTHLGFPKFILNIIYRKKFLRENSWYLLYLVDFFDKIKYFIYSILKMLGLYYPLREIYRKHRKIKK